MRRLAFSLPALLLALACVVASAPERAVAAEGDAVAVRPAPPPPPPLPPPAVVPDPGVAGVPADGEPVPDGDDVGVGGADPPAGNLDGPDTVLDGVGAGGDLLEGDVLDVVPGEGGAGGQRITRAPAFHGYVRTKYRLRTTGDDSDSDLYQYLMLQLGEDENYGFSGHFHGRLTADLDGRNDNRQQFYVFDSITDSVKTRLDGHIYQAYASYRARRGLVELVRVGRQDIEAGEMFLVDAVRLDTRPMSGRSRLRVSAFGGVPAHLWEGTPGGDLFFGWTLSARPWRGGEASFSYVHLKDQTRYYGAEVNDFASWTLRQQFSRSVNAWANYQHLNGDPRQLTLGVNANDARRDLFVRAFFHSLLTSQNEQAYDFDPYFSVALALEPYWSGTVSASKGIGDHLFVEGGVAVRELYDDADEGRYNHGWQRYFVIVSTDSWPWRHVNLSATGERWNSDDDTYSVGFEAEYRPSRRFRLQAGTDYALYRLDLYTAEERQSTRGYYLRVRYKPTRRLSLQLRLRVDNDAFDTYTTLLTGFDWEF